MGHRASPNGLQTWLWILAGLFVLCTLPLMAIALLQGTQRYTEADDNLVALRQLRQTFELANRVSAERGPANSLLGADVADAQEHARLAAQLAVARQRVDVAATGLHAVFEADPRVVEETPLLRDAQRRLQAARGTVDRVAALPLAERSVDEVDRAISSMFAVYDRLQALTSVQISDLVGADREAAIPALQGQVLIDLREHGGRLASNVMAPLAVPGAWRAQQVRAARQTEGRLLELWRLAASHESVFRSDPALSWHWDMARRQFFGQSLPMIEQLIEDGRRGVPPRWTAAEFTARYVPTLQSLEALRDGYLGVSIARFEHTRNREAVRLAVLAGTALGTLLILGLALRIAHVQILRPLLQAQAQVIQIASDTPGSAQHGTHPMAEMQRLFDAIEVLRAKSHQRAALTRELRELAGTDQLTGLLNRRSLDEQVQQRHAAGSTQAVVILLDVDHFKAINDGQGHAAGDDVLVQVAHLLQRHLRRNDSIARYGGEEFLVLLADADLTGARQLAETLRVALRQQDIALGDGQSLRVTASFGVAQGRLACTGACRRRRHVRSQGAGSRPGAGGGQRTRRALIGSAAVCLCPPQYPADHVPGHRPRYRQAAPAHRPHAERRAGRGQQAAVGRGQTATGEDDAALAVFDLPPAEDASGTGRADEAGLRFDRYRQPVGRQHCVDGRPHAVVQHGRQEAALDVAHRVGQGAAGIELDMDLVLLGIVADETPPQQQTGLGRRKITVDHAVQQGLGIHAVTLDVGEVRRVAAGTAAPAGNRCSTARPPPHRRTPASWHRCACAPRTPPRPAATWPPGRTPGT